LFLFEKTFLMKKRLLVTSIILLFIAGTAFVVLKSGRGEQAAGKIPVMLARNPAMSYEKEWKTVRYNADLLISQVERNDKDIKSMIALIGIYLQEARITGEYGYYNKAAMQLISTVLEKDTSHFEALVFKATVLLSRHQFAEARNLAEDLRNKFPYSAYVYGLLVDTYVELGNYPEAIVAAEKMISMRPDIRSYSRIAYLREIHGDLAGAIEAMNMAVEAGAPGDENTEWCRVQVGKLYEQCGKISEAREQYLMSLENRENFPPALTGLARLAVEEKEYAKALGLYFQADSLSSDHTIREGIAEIYGLTNRVEDERKVRKDILEHVKDLAKEGNEDMEMAHAYMGLGNYDKAFAYAMKEYEKRPNNIEVNETVAMVYAAQCEYEKALPFLENARKTNCKKPALLSLASTIYNRGGKLNKQAAIP
jgi:tetratricopeptide (TPR) repeat protein